MALLGGQTEPSDGFNIILRHAATHGVHPPEEVLRHGVALLGGFAVPGGAGFSIIFFSGVHRPEDKLRAGLTRLRAGTEVCESLFCDASAQVCKFLC